jgi:glycosyl transferase family 1
MRFLWIATKPPWPPVDGGRLVLLHTLRALADRGHEIELIAPVDEPVSVGAAEALKPVCKPTLLPISRRPAAVDFALARLVGEPWTVRRHRHGALRRAAETRAAAVAFDAVVAEQLQAVAHLPEPSGAPGPVRILRAQNVESELWRGAATLSGWRALLLRGEVRRLEAAEGRAVRAVDATAALTARDAEILRRLAGARARVEVLPAPFPRQGATAAPLSGAPAVVLFASGGWAPNEDAARWFVSEVWPRVLAGRSEARLHVFGGSVREGRGLEWHPAPEDSAAAFAADSIFAVPLRVGSGVRMKILEAWARGVPVIATAAGAAGLEAETTRELLVADGAAEMADGILRLAGDAALRGQLVKSAAEALERRHDPDRTAAAWEDLVESLRRR